MPHETICQMLVLLHCLNMAVLLLQCGGEGCMTSDRVDNGDHADVQNHEYRYVVGIMSGVLGLAFQLLT